MKKTVLFIYLIVLLAAAGCGQGNPAAPGFGREDLFLNVDGTRFFLHIDIETVFAALGDNYEYSEARSCDHDGMDKTFIYDTAHFYTFPLPKGDTVSEIFTSDLAVATSKGIRVGDGKEDVMAAYGDDCEDTGFQLIYNLPGGSDEGGSLCFDLEDGVVVAIYITTRVF